MARRQKLAQMIEESAFDVILKETLSRIGELEKEIIALHFKHMPEHKIVRHLWNHTPLFMRTGVRIQTYGFTFEHEIDAKSKQRRESATYPTWFNEWQCDELRQWAYLGVDLNEKHLPKYFDIIAKMRMVYDFSREKGADIFLPRIYCRLQRQGKTIGILTEDVSLDNRTGMDGISKEELEEQEKTVPLSQVFYEYDLDRSYFVITQSSSLLALVDVDHLQVKEEHYTRFNSLKEWYKRRDPFVISLDNIKK